MPPLFLLDASFANSQEVRDFSSRSSLGIRESGGLLVYPLLWAAPSDWCGSH